MSSATAAVAGVLPSVSSRVATTDEMLDPVAFVLSVNAARRHLTGDQIIALYLKANAAKLEADKQEAKVAQQAGLKKGSTQPEPASTTMKPTGKTAAKIAKAVGKSKSAVERVQRVQKVAPEQLADVAAGKISASEVLKAKAPKTIKPEPPVTQQNTVKAPNNPKPGSPKWVEEQVNALCEAVYGLQRAYPKLTGGQQARITKAQKALEHVARIGANFVQVDRGSRELVELWNRQLGYQLEGEYFAKYGILKVREAVACVPDIRPWQRVIEKVHAAHGSPWFTSERFEWLTNTSDQSDLEEIEREWATLEAPAGGAPPEAAS